MPLIPVLERNAISLPATNGHADRRSLLAQIGNTPLIRLRRIVEDLSPRLEVYAKAEWFNPAGSVKGRPALRMIEEGERSGQLTRDKIIIDSTSGNTGVAYAMIGAIKGYRVTLVMPENVSPERKQIARAYGAEIIFSDPLEGSDGAIRLVRELVQKNPERYFYPDQYNNPANWWAHYDTTGPEIIAQTEGRVTHFLAGLGTSGTLMGTGRRLKDFDPSIQVIAVEPADELEVIEGLKHMATAIVPGIYDTHFADLTVPVSANAALQTARRLAREEGLFVGFSAGAVMHVALRIGRNLDEGVMVVLFPDGGTKYVSLEMF